MPVGPQTSAKLLAGHESYIICPGQAPVKVTQTEPVSHHYHHYWPESLLRIGYRRQHSMAFTNDFA